MSSKRVSSQHDPATEIFDYEEAPSVPWAIRIAAADAFGRNGDPRLDPRCDEYWTTISQGPYLRGAQRKCSAQPNYDPDTADFEWPPHEVCLDPFRIGRYPVTVGQYQRFIEEGGYQDLRWWSPEGYGQFRSPERWEEQVDYPARPVVGVNWFEAAAFCAWAGGRLPTDAEWERAARGATARKFPWGDVAADPCRLNCAEGRIGHVTPVGLYPTGATPDGIFDMAGNAWEWCVDRLATYTSEPLVNPHGAERGRHRVVRGGSWNTVAIRCRAAAKDCYGEWTRVLDLGFRVAAAIR